MEAVPHRCPKCDALVVDRRSPVCTNCHEALPGDWIMTPEQIAKVEEIDSHAKAEHAAAMEALDPANDPTTSESTMIDLDST
jgi:hypothetical protein